MAKNPPFYQNITALDSQRHGDLSVAPKEDYRFAAGHNAVFVAAAEFGKAMFHYPIVFGGDDGRLFPVAVLGMRDGENLFLTPEWRWDADYVPAYVRRYPFVLAGDSGSENMAVCIDESYAGFNREGRGESLFNNGQQTDYLKRMISFLQDYQVQYNRTAALCGRLAELDLFEVMQVNMELKDGTKVNFQGFRAVSRKKLEALGDGDLLELARNGALELVYLHLHSLDNFNRLLKRLNARQT